MKWNWVIKEFTLAMRMKTTKRGLPSSSNLGKGGGRGGWYWRACIDLFPFASITTNLLLFCCCSWGLRLLWGENKRASCLVQLDLKMEEEEDLDLVGGTSAFKDILTSINTTILSPPPNNYNSLSLPLSLRYKVKFRLWDCWGS